MDRSELKGMAKEQIRGKIGLLFLIGLIIGALCGAAAAVPILGAIASGLFLLAPFSLSLAMLYLKMTHGEDISVGMVFDGFYDWWSSVKVLFLTGLFTFLWSLLLIVPGIVKKYAYSMAFYILAENKEMPALEAINRSKVMMDGHKWELFVLNLSFIPWYLLCVVTFGIATIWVEPYICATIANFYNMIKEENGEATVTALPDAE